MADVEGLPHPAVVRQLFVMAVCLSAGACVAPRDRRGSFTASTLAADRFVAHTNRICCCGSDADSGIADAIIAAVGVIVAVGAAGGRLCGLQPALRSRRKPGPMTRRCAGPLVRRIREKLGLPDMCTLDACRHGG